MATRWDRLTNSLLPHCGHFGIMATPSPPHHCAGALHSFKAYAMKHRETSTKLSLNLSISFTNHENTIQKTYLLAYAKNNIANQEELFPNKKPRVRKKFASAATQKQVSSTHNEAKTQSRRGTGPRRTSPLRLHAPSRARLSKRSSRIDQIHHRAGQLEDRATRRHPAGRLEALEEHPQIGRASCRERV